MVESLRVGLHGALTLGKCVPGASRARKASSTDRQAVYLGRSKPD